MVNRAERMVSLAEFDEVNRELALVREELLATQESLRIERYKNERLVGGTLSRIKHLPVPVIGQPGVGSTSLLLARSLMDDRASEISLDAFENLNLPRVEPSLTAGNAMIEIITNVHRFKYDVPLREHTNSLLSSSSAALLQSSKIMKKNEQ